MDLDFFLRHPQSTPFLLAFLGAHGAQDLLRFWLDAESCRNAAEAACVVLKYLSDKPAGRLGSVYSHARNDSQSSAPGSQGRAAPESSSSDWFDDVVGKDKMESARARSDPRLRSREYFLATIRTGLDETSVDRIIEAAEGMQADPQDTDMLDLSMGRSFSDADSIDSRLRGFSTVSQKSTPARPGEGATKQRLSLLAQQDPDYDSGRYVGESEGSPIRRERAGFGRRGTPPSGKPPPPSSPPPRARSPAASPPPTPNPSSLATPPDASALPQLPLSTSPGPSTPRGRQRMASMSEDMATAPTPLLGSGGQRFPRSLPSPVFNNTMDWRPRGHLQLLAPPRPAPSHGVYGRDALCVIQAFVEQVLRNQWWPLFQHSAHYREHSDDLRSRFFETGPESARPLQLEDVLVGKTQYFRAYIAMTFGPRVQGFCGLWLKLSTMRSSLLGVVSRRWASGGAKTGGSLRGAKDSSRAEGVHAARIVIQSLVDQGLLSWSNPYLNPEVYVGPAGETPAAWDDSGSSGDVEPRDPAAARHSGVASEVSSTSQDTDQGVGEQRLTNGIFDELLQEAVANDLHSMLDAQDACRRLMQALEEPAQAAFRAATALLRLQEELYQWFQTKAWGGFIQSEYATDMLTTMDSGNAAALMRHRSLVTVVCQHIATEVHRCSIADLGETFGDATPMAKRGILWDGDVVMRLQYAPGELRGDGIAEPPAVSDDASDDVTMPTPSFDGVRSWAERAESALGVDAPHLRSEAVSRIGVLHTCCLMEHLLLEDDVVVLWTEADPGKLMPASASFQLAKALVIELVSLLRPLELTHEVLVRGGGGGRRKQALSPSSLDRAAGSHGNVPAFMLLSDASYQAELLKAATDLEQAELGLGALGNSTAEGLGARVARAPVVLDLRANTLQSGPLAPSKNLLTSKKDAQGGSNQVQSSQNSRGCGTVRGFFHALVHQVLLEVEVLGQIEGLEAMPPPSTTRASQMSADGEDAERLRSMSQAFASSDAMPPMTPSSKGKNRPYYPPAWVPSSNPRLFPLSVEPAAPPQSLLLPPQLTGTLPQLPRAKEYEQLRDAAQRVVLALIRAFTEHLRLVPDLGVAEDFGAESDDSYEDAAVRLPRGLKLRIAHRDSRHQDLPEAWFALINASFYTSDILRRLTGKPAIRFAAKSLDWDLQSTFAYGSPSDAVSPCPSTPLGLSPMPSPTSRMAALKSALKENVANGNENGNARSSGARTWGEARLKANTKRLKVEAKIFLKRFVETAAFGMLVEDRVRFLVREIAK